MVMSLKEKYESQILPEMLEASSSKNRLAVPRLTKIVISMGVGAAMQDKKRIELAAKDLAMIAGQKPLVCKTRKAVSNFKTRVGFEIGLKVTLRGQRMYDFMDRLIHFAIPRMRDFRGLNPRSFDGRGNYSMGVQEQSIFPEIDPAAIEWPQGMNITIVTTAKNDRESRELLTKMGMPFRREDNEKSGDG